ncbi:MAG: Maf family protein [Clostridia bacterium]|nr:Maf family protein [Clostridia bacterium]
MKLILASNSPRRKDILRSVGFDFKVITSGYDEKGDGDAETLVKTFAYGKAKSVFDSLTDAEKKQSVVLGADTVVALNGKILGKPKDEKAAAEMLKNLSGKTHYVFTGYAIISDNESIVGLDKTEVTFNRLSDELISEYVATGSPLDKAGAYGIQDGFPLVKEYKGSLNNVIGIPIEKIKPIIEKLMK